MGTAKRKRKRHHGTGSLLRVKHPRGVRWRAGFYDQHGKRRFRTGSPGEAKSDAEKRMRGYLTEVDAGTYLHPGEEPKPEGTAFDTFADQFLEEYTGRRGLRSDYYAVQVPTLVSYWKQTLVETIDRVALNRWQRALVHGGTLKVETIRKRLTCMGTMLGFAYDLGLLDTNPAWRLRKPAGERTPYRHLSADEWSKLLAATEAAEDRHEWELPLYRLTLSTASRRQEVLSLKWDDVRDGYLYIHQGKVGRGKKVPIGKVAKSVLAEREPFRFRSPYVFAVLDTRPSRRRPNLEETWRPLNGNHVSKLFLERLRAAKIHDNEEGRAAFHSLRSTAATWLARDGFNELQIGLALGHKLSQSVTQTYIRVPEVPAEVVSALDGYQMDIFAPVGRSGIGVSR